MTVTRIGEAVISAPLGPQHDEILTAEAVDFVVDLVRQFGPRVDELLAARAQRQLAFDEGLVPDFLPQTRDIREADWRVAALPADLLDRRVEITGPVDRKLMINALNAPVSCYMADFEDAQVPLWTALIEGQINLRDAVKGTIRHETPEGRVYELAENPATLLVRPRGWHQRERHLIVDGRPIPAALMDFGLYLFHNARARIAQGSGPYFYLPKLEGHLEARLWNEIFHYAEGALSLTAGCIKATILIETLPAVFEMDEILYELRQHAVGLNCGRWDYIFSTIKTFRARPDRLMPDRQSLSMDCHFLDSWSKLVCRTSHRRGAAAIGGMAAYIPVHNDEEANAQAIEQVRADKEREADNGHDGSWIAHPDLAPVAREVFDARFEGPNQIDRPLDWEISAEDILSHPEGEITESGLRQNISIGIQYLEAWLSGNACVPLYNLMEDAATAEICRVQIWQWTHHDSCKLADGREVSAELVEEVIDEEMENIRAELGEERFDSGRFDTARALFAELSLADSCAEFLTQPAYELLQ